MMDNKWFNKPYYDWDEDDEKDYQEWVILQLRALPEYAKMSDRKFNRVMRRLERRAGRKLRKLLKGK